MKTALLVPFGSLSEEAGLMHVLLQYMSNLCSSKQSLQCNGLFSLCDRDSLENWRRGLLSCARCIQDQSLLANCSQAQTVQLSSFLKPEEVRVTSRWMQRLADQDLTRAVYASHNIFDLCRGSFARRFDTLEPDLKHKHHLGFMRRLMLSATRALHVSKNYLQAQKPDLCLVAGGQDFISQSFCLEAKKKGVRLVRFSWDAGGRHVRVLHPESGAAYSCAFSLEDLSQIRGEVESWPAELVEILEEILLFLDLTELQLQLPIAQ